jgi:hypothetical protein
MLQENIAVKDKGLARKSREMIQLFFLDIFIP